MVTNEIAPPSRADIHTAPWAAPRSWNGNQALTTRVMFGNAPASPLPNRKRIATRANSTVVAPVDRSKPGVQLRRKSAAPVRAVNSDQNRTSPVSTRRAAQRSPIHPSGTSKSP